MTRLLLAIPAAILAAGVAFGAISAGEDTRAPKVTVTVRNDLPIARPSETIELSAQSLAALGSDLTRLHVYEAVSGREVLAQSLDLDADGTHESLIFQTDMPARGERTFEIRRGEKRTYRKEDFRAYGRFVRERHDDFAWENDRVAHRMYGPALETWQRDPLTSSTVDVWLKRTRRLVINDWYMVDDYHRDHGEGADFYSAGRSRGCGGSGLWRDGRLIVSRNFRESRVLANGPIRLVFELRYPVWDDPAVRHEVKRVTLDAGQNFNRFESRYELNAGDDIRFAAGIKKDPAATFRADRAAGWIRTWEPVKDAGEFGCAIVLDPATLSNVTEADGNYVAIGRLAPGKSAVYYAGSGWNRSGDFADVAAWDAHVEQWARRIRSPLRVEVGK